MGGGGGGVECEDVGFIYTTVSRCVQFLPLQCSAHTHRQESSSCSHVPPLWQGFDAQQSRGTVRYKRIPTH